MKEHKHSGNSILRCVLVAVSLLFQVGWILLQVLRLNQYSVWISLTTSILAALVVIQLYSKHTTSATKMPWIMLILVFPVMGLSLYLMTVLSGDLGSNGKRLKAVKKELEPFVKRDCHALQALEITNAAAAGQCHYLQEHIHAPVYQNTSVQYFTEAANAFDAMKEELEKAEKFIFMEYFIISDTSAFREILEILERKAARGVEVRLMYDDLGSVGYVNFHFARKLNDRGIKCRPFNPALPILNVFLNHRDHRKITVIDGRVGFTGGYNLSDEYFDRTHPYGKWKDTGIRLEGEAVRSLTALFLEMWNTNLPGREDYGRYLDIYHSVQAEGFVQPYGDDPLDEERTAENVYLNIINSAQKTLWFATPYLIITEEMGRALGLAAKRGVDVRIITPGIPDKKTVFAVTRSYYAGLAAQGVRIFEYAPGFCHAKQCVCDGKVASIGTSNLDYRSLYLHFENNVILYHCDAVEQMAADFENTFPVCREVTEVYRTGRGRILRTWQCILRLFAPMM